MSPSKDEVARLLVIHPEAAARRSVGEALRSIAEGPITVYEASSPAQGLEAARHLDPRVVLIDLNEERRLALEVVRGLRGSQRLVVGLYNPLLLAAGEMAAFFREASRAGVGDYVPLPVGEAELRAALAFVPEEEGEQEPRLEGQVITFLSPKGGVGTTTLAVSTAMVLAGSGVIDRGVALCDASGSFGTAAATLGMAPNRDLADLVRDLDVLTALGSYVAQDERTGLAVLAGPRDPYEAETITPEDLSRVIIQLRRRYGRVVIDAPPTLDLLTLAAIDLSERLYVVTEAMAPTLVATARFLRLLEQQGFMGERVRLVVNRFAPGDNVSQDLLADQLGRPVDFMVPFDRSVVAGANRGAPVVVTNPDAPFSEGVGAIAEQVAGGAVAAGRVRVR